MLKKTLQMKHNLNVYEDCLIEIHLIYVAIILSQMSIIHSFGYHKVAAWWIPRLITDDQKNLYLALSTTVFDELSIKRKCLSNPNCFW